MTPYLKDDDDLNMETIMDEIKLELRTVQQVLNAKENDPTQQEAQQPARKKKKFLRMACEGGASAEGDDLSQRNKEVYDSDQEVVRYSREPQLDDEGDPQLWWRENKRQFPCMAYLSKKYLAVQATSTSAKRLMSLLGNVVTKK